MAVARVPATATSTGPDRGGRIDRLQRFGEILDAAVDMAVGDEPRLPASGSAHPSTDLLPVAGPKRALQRVQGLGHGLLLAALTRGRLVVLAAAGERHRQQRQRDRHDPPDNAPS